MAPTGGGENDVPQPPQHLYERLALLKGYTWDQTIELFHSASPVYKLVWDPNNIALCRAMIIGMSSVFRALGVKHQLPPQRTNPPRAGAPPEQAQAHVQRPDPRTQAEILQPQKIYLL